MQECIEGRVVQWRGNESAVVKAVRDCSKGGGE